MCRMRPHSEIVRSALERRAEWLREASAKLLQETIDSLSPVIEKLQQYKMEFMSQSLAEDQAISRAIGRVLKEYSGRLPPAAEPIVDAFSHKSVLGLLREQLKGSNSSGDAKVQEAIKTRLKKVVAEETRRRGKCAYWVIPQEQ